MFGRGPLFDPITSAISAGIGGITSLIGGSMAADGASDAAGAQVQAGRDAMQAYDTRTAQGAARQLALLYGPAEAEKIIRGTFDADTVNKLLGRSAKPGGKDEIKGTIDRDAWNAMGPGLSSEMDAYRQLAADRGAATLTGLDGDTSALLRDSQAIEAGARDFGETERRRINRDAGETLIGLNRLTESKLRGVGLGSSSVLGNQLAGNTRDVFNATQDQQGALGDRQIGLMTGLKKDTLGLKTNRMNQRTGLSLSLDDRDLGLRAKPIDMKLQSFTGAAMNPWLGQNTTQYFPGVSGGAAASQTWGNMLSGMGGQLAGAGAYGLLNQGGNSSNQADLLKLLRQLGTGN